MRTALYLSTNGHGKVSVSGNTVTGVGTSFKPSDVGNSITLRTPAKDIRTNIYAVTSATQITIELTLDIAYADIYYYLGYTSVDLYDNVPFPMTYNIADVRKPEKRNTTHSKTIRIPGTPTNNKLFGHVFEIDLDGQFNPNIKALAYAETDTVLQFRGACQLLRVNILGDKIEYEIALYGTTGGFLFNLTGRTLRELDLSDYNHNIRLENVTDSWFTQIQKNGTEYVNFSGTTTTEFSSGQPIGEGYVYPLLDNGHPDTNTLDWRIEFMPPCIYVKTIVDAMFDAAGYSYTSTFFNDTTPETSIWNKLIVPGTTWHRKATFDIQIKIAQSTYQNHYTFRLRRISILNNVDEIYYEQYVINNNANGFTQSWQFKDIKVLPADRFYIEIRSESEDINGVSQDTILVSNDTYWSVVYDDAVETSGLTDYSFYAFLSTNQAVTGTEVLALDNDSTGAGYDTNGTFNTSTHRHTVGNTNLQAVLPDKVKCVDLFIWLVNMFNLYVDQDRENPTNLIIEPRDTYYSQGDNIDWHNKLDLSKMIELVPMGELDFRSLRYTYKEDGDFWNQKYKNNWKEIHGQMTETVDNDFVKSENVTEIGFAPTPTVQTKGNSDIKIPAYIKDDPAPNLLPNAVDNALPRILIYNGVKTNGIPVWELREKDLTDTPYQFLYYPQAGMWNDTEDPTQSIMFGTPREVYFTFLAGNDFVDNNLFKVYHSTYVAEIVDKDSKIVVAYMNLTPLDIFNLDFRNLFFFDGHFMRLNKIVDYDFVTDKPTRCEFIRVKKKSAYMPPRVPPKEEGGGAHIISGGINEVRSIKATSFYNVVEGGLDEIRDIGATSPIHIIKG